jgi:cytoskeletal protein CcmA (bactofilin family)
MEVKMELITKEPRMLQDMVATTIHAEGTTKVDKTLEVARMEDIMILEVEAVAITIPGEEVVATMIATKDIIMIQEEDTMILVVEVEAIMIATKVVVATTTATKVEIEANSNKGAAGSERVSLVIVIRVDTIGINHQLEELLCLMKEVESQRVVTQYISLAWEAM